MSAIVTPVYFGRSKSTVPADSMRKLQGDPQWTVLPLWTLFLLVGAAQRCPAQDTDAPELYGYEVVAEYPHDPEAFTQGTVRGGGLAV